MGENGDESRMNEFLLRVEEVLEKGEAVTYEKVRSFAMVGLAIVVHAKMDLVSHIREIDCDRVKTGAEGMSGNKGGLAVRFELGNVSWAFVNVHLPSGQKNSEARSRDARMILRDGFQSKSIRGGAVRASKGLFNRSSQYVLELHNVLLLAGDINSRLDVREEGIPADRNLDRWLELDELRGDPCCIDSLANFSEGEVSFPPTFKYHPVSDTFNPKRTPAWCDRVLYQVKGGAKLELKEYDSCPSLKATSDHRAVTALFAFDTSSGSKPDQPAFFKDMPAGAFGAGAAGGGGYSSAAAPAAPGGYSTTSAPVAAPKVGSFPVVRDDESSDGES